MNASEIRAAGKAAKKDPDAPFRPGILINPENGRVAGNSQCDRCASTKVRVWDVGHGNEFCSYCTSRYGLLRREP